MVLTDRSRVELVPPAGLPHDPDRGIYQVFACRWGEPIERPHQHAGKAFDRGEVRLPDPDRLGELVVNVDHRPDEEIGQIVKAISTPFGLWCSVRLGRVGRDLLAIGHRGVSIEVDDAGQLCGLALAVGAPAGLPSARVLVDGPVTVARLATAPVTATSPKLSREPDPFRQKSGTLIGGGEAAVAPSEWSLPSVDTRPVSRTEADVEAEVARAQALEEDRQRSLAEAAGWDDWYACYLRELRERGRQMQREQDEAQKRRAELELERPWQALDVWLDASLERLQVAL